MPVRDTAGRVVGAVPAPDGVVAVAGREAIPASAFPPSSETTPGTFCLAKSINSSPPLIPRAVSAAVMRGLLAIIRNNAPAPAPPAFNSPLPAYTIKASATAEAGSASTSWVVEEPIPALANHLSRASPTTGTPATFSRMSR